MSIKEEGLGQPAAPLEGKLVDPALECFVALLGFLDRPAESDQLQHALGKGGERLTFGDLLRLAKRLDVKARVVSTSFAKLANHPLPAIAQLADGRCTLLLQVVDDRVLVFDPSCERPVTIPVTQFAADFAGELLIMTTRERVAGAARAFDVTWFIPALVKYRHLLRDVLVASFFLQILALVTPLFFQVVIDKVLVHKGLTTLEVLVAGLLVVSVFDVVMGGLRTYLFSHTTSRVDAELGAKLFAHLTHLPLAYFQSRRVGDTVARVRELETIREFLTSSALTVCIDLLFAVVFLAVMWLYSPTLLLIVLATLPLYAAVVMLVGPALRRKLDEKFARGAENQSFLVEAVTGVETLKAQAVEPQAQNRWERQLAGTLSGGEQQMLALARGLMPKPKLLLLDEPSLGLAPKLVTQLFQVIRQIHRQGITILLVEQNAYQALQVASEATVLETGRVVLQGSAADLKENPAVKQAYLGG